MSAPARKRRKGNDVLFKPFKSPMRVSTGDEPETNTLKTPESTTTPKWTLARTPKSIPILDTTDTTEISSLRREQSRLLAQLSKLKIEADQIKQARGIEESGRDSELLNLIKLWKTASQAAAEEVYATLRDKVNADGGMRRWREMERERRENVYSNWGTEEAKDDRSGAEDAEGDDQDDTESDRVEHEHRDQTEDLESFSMDVMLQYLSIQLDVIGYNAQEQRWTVD